MAQEDEVMCVTAKAPTEESSQRLAAQDNQDSAGEKDLWTTTKSYLL